MKKKDNKKTKQTKPQKGKSKTPAPVAKKNTVANAKGKQPAKPIKAKAQPKQGTPAKTKSPAKTVQKTASKGSTAKQNSASKAVSTKAKAQPPKGTPAKVKTPAKTPHKTASKGSTAKQVSATKAVSAKPEKVNTVSITIKSLPDSNGGHIHFIVDNLEDKHVSVGITHDKFKGENHPNIPLDVNPTGGKEPSYMKRQGTVAKQTRYSDEQQGKISERNLAQAKTIGEKAKQKQLNKKK